MNIANVVILKGKNPSEMTVKALETIKAQEALSNKKPVLIKPNYIQAKPPITGITTDCRIIEGVVKFLKKHTANEIIIGEGSGFSNTFEAFKIAGVYAFAKSRNIRLIDLNNDEFFEVEPPNPLTLKKIKIAKTVLKSTIISVPKLKLHRLASVTLSLKNMLGAIAPKGSMHVRLSKNIVDLVSVIKPSIAVLDGIIAGEGHETSGNPVRMDLVVAGTDPVATDAVGSAIMGLQPKDVKHLRLAEKKGLGTCNLKNIKITGEPIEKVRKQFKRSLSSRFLTRFV